MKEMGGGLPRLPSVRHGLRHPERAGELMKNTKFVVKVNRGSTHVAEYVKRIDRTPIQTTTNPKLALVMGRFTAEDTVKSIQNSRRRPELVPVQVNV
jgi:hypothetical protein